MSDELLGRTVVVTRAATQNNELIELLTTHGAKVVELPLIAIAEPLDNGRQRDELLQRLNEFDWIVVTSPNGAERVAPFLALSSALNNRDDVTKIAVVGEATARTLGHVCDLVASPARATQLVHQFPTGSGSVLLVQGDLADTEVANGLTDLGWHVTSVVAYRTAYVRPSPDKMLPALAADILLLASSSAVLAWFDVFGASTPPIVISLGPSTSSTAMARGLSVTATASEQSMTAFVQAAIEACK
ncbi:MAG: uroporphyrinogen-III synthase [Ilumatobacteraceae bacterium]|nr:uroporphyrinogen-III synthase [Ilumatobacteraceae bacterium]